MLSGWADCDAQKFLKQSDSNKSGDVALNEFINYVREHEKNLQLQFSHLDRNNDGELASEPMESHACPTQTSSHGPY